MNQRRHNPYKSLSRTVRLDTVAYMITQTSKAPILKQSHAALIDESAVFQHLNVNVNSTQPFVLLTGYKHALIINSPFALRIVLTQNDNVTEFIVKGSYSAMGIYEGKVEIYGMEEEFTRCSLVSA